MKPSKERQSECYFCGMVRAEVVEDHHVIPKKVVLPHESSSVDTAQTIQVCANCHYKMHAAIEPLIQYMTEKIKDAPDIVEPDFQKASDLSD